MPFVSSIRGGFGLSRRGPLPFFNIGLNSSGVSGGSITTAGGYRIHTFSYTGGDQTFTVAGAGGGSLNGTNSVLPNVECYLYAGGGGAGNPSSWGRWSSGAGSGFAGGTISQMSAGTYKIVVGQGGGGGQSGRTAYGGGGAGVSWGNGGGGGLSGIFQNDSFTQANAILIAGGGGGGGASRVASDGCGGGNRGGGGGGSVGQDGEAVDNNGQGRGGTQSAGGAGASLGGQRENGGALVGGNASGHGAGGAGGYFGGGAGTYWEPNTMGGGGGGSAYFKPSGTSAITSAILTSGDRCTTANTGGIYYAGSTGVSGQSQGAEGQPGRIVIRYLSS